MSRYVPLYVIRQELAKHYEIFGHCTTIPTICKKLLKQSDSLLEHSYKNPLPANSELLSDEEYMSLFLSQMYPIDNTINALERHDEFSYTSETLFSPNNLFWVFLHENYAKQGMHRHDFFEITYIFKGKCHIALEDNSYNLSEGNIFIIAPNTLHEPYVLDSDSFVINLSMTREAFEAAFSVVLLRNDLISTYIKNILYKSDVPNYLFIPSDNSPSIKNAIKHLSYENKNNRYYSYSFCISWLSVFMCSALDSYQSGIYAFDKTPNEMQANRLLLIEYIQKNYRNATLQSVAEFFSYNPSYLSRLIQQILGKSFIEIITELKLNAGKELLEHTKLSLDEIAEIVGYTSGDYFSKAFKKANNISASEYRRNL